LEWKQAVDALSSEVHASKADKRGNLNPSIILNALTGWLNSSLTEDRNMAVSAYEAFSRRVAFLFSNNYILTVGTGITPTIARLSKEITGDQPLPFEGMLEENWNFFRPVNGWRRNENLSNEDLGKLVLSLSDETEPPILILPFEDKLYILPFEDKLYEREDKEQYHTWLKLLELFTEENQQKTADTMGISLIVCGDDEYMSEHCDWSRLIRLTTKLEKSEDLSQVKDQWFASFNDSHHLPDGTFTAVVYDLYPDEQRSFKKLASECGLDAGPWQEGKFVAEGDIYFGR
jgi:hypothetical protein